MQSINVSFAKRRFYAGAEKPFYDPNTTLCDGFETFRKKNLPAYFQCEYNKVIRRGNPCEPKKDQNLGLFVLFLWFVCDSDYRFDFVVGSSDSISESTNLNTARLIQRLVTFVTVSRCFAKRIVAYS